MAASRLLELFPDDISENYLPYQSTLRQRQRADLFSRGQYVNSVTIKQKDDIFDVDALCFRSQRKNDQPHRISLSVDAKTKQVTQAYCSCKAGMSGECAHILAVLYTIRNWILQGLKDVPSDPACTSLPQQWGKPRGSKIVAEPVSTMVISRPGTLARKRRPLMAQFTDIRNAKVSHDDLQKIGQSFSGTAMAYLLEGTHHQVETGKGMEYLGSSLATQIPLMQPLPEPTLDGGPCGDLNFPQGSAVVVPDIISRHLNEWTDLTITLDDAFALERDTQQQSTSQLWLQHRLCRVTASHFGRFMTRKAPIIARQMYIKSKSFHVHACGLVVNPHYPFLEASPDGKVCDTGCTGIIEIKCPFSVRDLTVKEALDSEKSSTFFLEKDGTNIRLKRNHIYWYQVQTSCYRS